MTSGFAERLRLSAEARGLRQADIYRSTKISRQALSDYFAGNKVVGTDKLFALADALAVDPRWLITGAAAALPQNVLDLGSSAVDKLGLKMIPEVDIAYSMGGGRLIEDQPNSQMVPFRRDWLDRLTRGYKAEVFLTRGQGDSMMPTILDDDDVLVNRADNVVRHQDRIWALGYGELGMIKRVRRLPNGMFQLNSDNPTVSAVEATEDELFIVGRVIWIGRRV